MGRFTGKFQSAETQILGAIVIAGKKGVSKKDLLSITGVDQSTAYRITDKLEKRGDIEIIRKGQRTSYRIVSDARINVAYASSILGRYAVSELFKKSVPVIYNETVEKKIVNLPTCTEFYQFINENNRHFQPKFKSNDYIGMALFEFSVRLGAYLTYLFIVALDPKNKFFNNDPGRDDLVKQWLTYSVSQGILSTLLHEFKDSIYQSLGLFPRGLEDTLKYRRKRPEFVIGDKIAKSAFRTFARLYPSINERLTSVIVDLLDKVKLEREEDNRILQKS